MATDRVLRGEMERDAQTAHGATYLSIHHRAHSGYPPIRRNSSKITEEDMSAQQRIWADNMCPDHPQPLVPEDCSEMGANGLPYSFNLLRSVFFKNVSDNDWEICVEAHKQLEDTIRATLEQTLLRVVKFSGKADTTVVPTVYRWENQSTITQLTLTVPLRISRISSSCNCPVKSSAYCPTAHSFKQSHPASVECLLIWHNAEELRMDGYAALQILRPRHLIVVMQTMANSKPNPLFALLKEQFPAQLNDYPIECGEAPVDEQVERVLTADDFTGTCLLDEHINMLPINGNYNTMHTFVALLTRRGA